MRGGKFNDDVLRVDGRGSEDTPDTDQGLMFAVWRRWPLIDMCVWNCPESSSYVEDGTDSSLTTETVVGSLTVCDTIGLRVGVAGSSESNG